MGRALLVTVVMLFGLACPWFVEAQETGQAAGSEVGDARALRAFLLEKGATEADVERVVTGAKRYGVIVTASHVISYASPSQVSPDDQKDLAKIVDFGTLKQISSQERTRFIAEYLLYEYLIRKEDFFYKDRNTLNRIVKYLADFSKNYNNNGNCIFYLKSINKKIYLYVIPAYFNSENTKYLLDDYICNFSKEDFHRSKNDSLARYTLLDNCAYTSRCLTQLVPDYIDLLYNLIEDRVNDAWYGANLLLFYERKYEISEDDIDKLIVLFKKFEKLVDEDMTPYIENITPYIEQLKKRFVNQN